MMSASLKPWLVAARPRTLPLAIAAIALGTFLAAARSPLNWPVTLFTFLTALLLQILSNFANDYGDFVHGADVERQGPLRAVQGGLISREAMLRAMLITAIAAAVSGLAMLILAFGGQRTALILLFVALGGAAIWAAVAYTATSKPYGYVGLGDLFVLIFFGWVGAMGAYFLQTGTLDFKIMLPATAVGLLSVGVLNINNIRDIESDPLAGKISIPVRIGRRNAQIYHLGLLAGAVLAALLFVLFTDFSAWHYLFVLSLPLLWKNGRGVWVAKESAEVAPFLKQLAAATLVFVLTFGLGYVLG